MEVGSDASARRSPTEFTMSNSHAKWAVRLSPLPDRPVAVAGLQPSIDVAVNSLEAAALLHFRFPPFHMVSAGIVDFPFRTMIHLIAWAFAPALTDPLRRYPEAPETVITVTKLWRMDYVIVGGPITLWSAAAVEVTKLCHRRASTMLRSTASHSARSQRLEPGPTFTGGGYRPALMPR
jgi:hypothetical protein